MARKPDRSAAIYLIAVFKLMKAALLLGVGIAAFKFMNADLGDTLKHWSQRFHVEPGNHYLQLLLEKTLSVSPKKIEIVGIVTLIYAAMFGTEGVGLMMGKRWAEYTTVITTAGLLPLEIYEIFEHVNGWKIAAVVINAAAVAYLIVRLWNTREQKEQSGHSPAQSAQTQPQQ